MQRGGITHVAEIAYVALILAVAGIVWRAASALPPAPYDPLGPKTFPIWVSYGLAALGLVMLARLLFGRSLGRAPQAMVVGLEDLEAKHARRPWVAVLILILAFAYAAGLSFRSVGFLPATAIYLFLSGVRARSDRAPPHRFRCHIRDRCRCRTGFCLPHHLQARSNLEAAPR